MTKRFHEVMGETPFSYLTRWQIHLAASLLTTANLSIADIAAVLGSAGPSAFARSFLAAVGETPARHRRHHRQLLI